jgi:hypothetical protein
MTLGVLFYWLYNKLRHQIRYQYWKFGTMTGATATVTRCRRRPDGEITDSQDIAMCIEVAVGVVRVMDLGIASLINQIFIIVVNCWITDCKKFKKITPDTPTMASAVATPSSNWTNPLTTIPSLTPYDAFYSLVSIKSVDLSSSYEIYPLCTC